MTRTKREWLAAFLFSAAVLLLMAQASPLHAGNNWLDTNCFVTVARGMIAGKIPYRDLIEQKGPLLYLLHVPAMLISPRGYFGIYLLEVAEYACFVVAVMRIARLLGGNRAVLPAILLTMIPVASTVFAAGDSSAEEMVQPLLAWSVYDALRYLQSDAKKMSARTLLRNGFLAGCVLWIKFSLLGVHFVWMAWIAVDCVIREKKLLPAVKMCLWFLGGMAVSALPWLVYFGANGALKDLLEVYFVWNITMYPQGSPVSNLKSAIRGMALKNPVMSALCLIAGGFALLMFIRKRSRAYGCLTAMIVCSTLTAFVFGRSFTYNGYALALYVPLAAVPMTKLLEKIAGNRQTMARALSGILCAAICLCGLAIGRGRLATIGETNENWTSTVFAREIRRTENPTLLNFGFLDGGFYFAADLLPTEKWFCGLNVNPWAGRDAQFAAVEEGRIDYVVTKKQTLAEYGVDDSKYEEIARRSDGADQPFYYLYRKTDLCPEN